MPCLRAFCPFSSTDEVEADAKHSMEVVSVLLDILERTSHLTPAPVQQPKAPGDTAPGAARTEADAAAASGRTTRRTTRASRQAAAASGPEQSAAAAAGDGATEEEYAQAMQSLQVCY